MDKTFLIDLLGGPLAGYATWLAWRTWQRAVKAACDLRTSQLQSLLQTRTADLERESALRQELGARMTEFVSEYRQLRSCLPDGFALADHAGNIIDTNEMLSHMTGWSRGALLQMNLYQLDATCQHAESPPFRAPAIGKSDLRLRQKDGLTRDVEWRVIPVPEVARFICIVRALSPRRGQPLRLVRGTNPEPQDHCHGDASLQALSRLT